MRPLVISGPSGAGKSTLLKRLFAEFPDAFGFSVSRIFHNRVFAFMIIDTTRAPRPGEENGRDYHFTSREEFLALVEARCFVEHAIFSGNMYGTSTKAVEAVRQQGKVCILDVDRQGVQSVKKTELNARYVFIKPPSIAVLEQRLRGRGTETEDSLQRRLETVKEDFSFAERPGAYDAIIVNDDLERAYSQLRQFIKESYSLQ